MFGYKINLFSIDKSMDSLKGKRLLLLGSNLWKDDIKRFADENGIYLIFAGLYPGPLDTIADEYYRIDTTDSSVMIPFIKEHSIDGIFMGGSELIISASCDYINELGYPCYCTKKQWDILQNKNQFKECCKQYNVPTVPEFDLSSQLQNSDYPVIVKPVDACSSKGISVCYDSIQYENAKQSAFEVSPSKRIIVERYIDNGGITNDVYYVAIDGEYYLDAMGDRYVLNGGLITAAVTFPSAYLDPWINNVDPMAREMMKGLGIKNGVVAFQVLPEGDKLYVYECCFRLTGGMTYKMTDAVSGHNCFKLLFNHVLTGRMGDENDVSKIAPYFNGKKGVSITIPLRLGTISSIQGFDEVKSLKQVVDYTHYYEVGDTIVSKSINTLDQLFARIMIVSDTDSELKQSISLVRRLVSIKDENGKEMIIWDTVDELFGTEDVLKIKD